MKMRHKIRHRKRKCVILSAIFPLSKPKQSSQRPKQEAPQLGFKGFFIRHIPAHPVSLNTTILIPVGIIIAVLRITIAGSRTARKKTEGVFSQTQNI